MKKSIIKGSLSVITCLFLITIGILSTYYYTYSEVYERTRPDYGPTKFIKDAEVFINIQMTAEGHKKTSFGNEYRSPYRVSFVFKGKKGVHELVEIKSVKVIDSLENQYSLVKDGNSLIENFELWPNGTWGTTFATYETFAPDFIKNPKLVVQTDCILTIKGKKLNAAISEEFKSNTIEQSGYSAINFIGVMLGLL